MENALGDPWKDVDHGIKALLLRYIGQLHDTCSIAEEFAIEETIHQIHLHYDIDEAQ